MALGFASSAAARRGDIVVTVDGDDLRALTRSLDNVSVEDL